MDKCKFYEDGYCIYFHSIEEQEDKETQWECDGSEESMMQCGYKHTGE